MDENSIESLLNEIIDSNNEIDEENLNSELEKVISEKATEALRFIKENAITTLAYETSEKIGFEERNYALWKEPLDLLELFLITTKNIGNEFNQKHRPDAAKNNDFVFEALTRLHGRACQVGFEILTLLKAGYADGANARWRTLYEISAFSYYIKNNGNEMAEKYLLYHHIESYRSISDYLKHPELYKKHKEFLGDELLSQEEMEEIKKRKENLCSPSRFGEKFSNNYGWAGPKINNFRDLETEVGIDHIRPYYKMANISIHAGPKGIRFSLGSLDKNIIPAGPSNMGLADPGSNTAISLHNINTALLTTKLNIENLIFLKAMNSLVNEINEALFRCHKYTWNEYERRKKEMETSEDDNQLSD